MRRILAGVAGFVTTVAAIMLVQALGHALMPPPGDIDMGNRDAAAQYLANAPAVALAFVLLAYFAGAFLGPFVARWLGGGSGKPYAYLLGGFVLGGTLITVYQLPHPPWFVIVAVIGIPVSAWYGAKLGPRRVEPGQRPVE